MVNRLSVSRCCCGCTCTKDGSLWMCHGSVVQQIDDGSLYNFEVECCNSVDSCCPLSGSPSCPTGSNIWIQVTGMTVEKIGGICYQVFDYDYATTCNGGTGLPVVPGGFAQFSTQLVCTEDDEVVDDTTFGVPSSLGCALAAVTLRVPVTFANYNLSSGCCP